YFKENSSFLYKLNDFITSNPVSNETLMKFPLKDIEALKSTIPKIDDGLVVIHKSLWNNLRKYHKKLLKLSTHNKKLYFDKCMITDFCSKSDPNIKSYSIEVGHSCVDWFNEVNFR
ncbi:MAG: hypothetical protein MHPSP_001575, partial [Paramarteilia canceri]